jgi:hypothetical protein
VPEIAAAVPVSIRAIGVKVYSGRASADGQHRQRNE